MKIGLRYGHSINCRGASKILDEVNQCRQLYFRVKELLEGLGHTVVNCCSDAYSESAELAEGTNKANANGVDLYVTLHMNSYNSEANGVECWVYDTASTSAINVASKVCSNINRLGIYNRGVKYGGNRYHDLSSSTMDAIIIESIFCDSMTDVNIYNANKEQFARAIANGIDSNVSLRKTTEIDAMSYEGKQEVDCKITTYASSTVREVLYRFYYELNGKWTTATDWQELNRFSFAPRLAGTYKVVCHVKFKDNNTDKEDAYNFITINIKDKPNIYNMKVDNKYYGQTYYEDIAQAVNEQLEKGVAEITLIKK